MMKLAWILPFLLVACAGAGTKKDEAASAKAGASSAATTATKKAEAKKGDMEKAVEEKSESAEGGGSEVNCASGNDKRTLAVTAAGGGCDLTYTKHGGSKSIASSRSGMEYCNATMQKTRGNLEKSGFKCE